MKKRVSTHIFNFRLYIEGLKRLKVIAMATLILAVVISALIPVLHWIEYSEYQPMYDGEYGYSNGYVVDEYGNTVHIEVNSPPQAYVDRVEQSLLAPAIYGVMFLAPFFLLVLFRFLNKRRESDFFHAIPYTRICTYISFLTAGLTAVFAIIALSVAVSGILWTVNPYAEVYAADLICQALISMLGSAMLAGIMMLAITLTGTTASSVIFFGFFSAFWRWVLYLFEEYWNYHIYPLHEVSYFKVSWFLPIGACNALTEDRYYDSYAEYWELSNILYSLLVTVALLVISGVIYKHRKSEMAGQTAPNRLLGHIFRCLFALPVALLIYPLGSSPTEILIIIVATLLVYYLYELLTTKKLKSLPKATPWLLGVVAGVLLFGGVRLGMDLYLLHENVEADEIKSVTLTNPSEVYGNSYTYEMIYLSECFGDVDELTSADPDAIKIVAEQLESTQYGDRTNWTNTLLSDAHWLTFDIHLKGGRTITRRIFFGTNKLNHFKFNFTEGLEAENPQFKQSEMLALRAEDIKYVSICNDDGDKVEEQQWELLLRTYLEEYELLTLEEQTAHQSLDTYWAIRSQESVCGFIEITRGNSGASTTFLITDKTYETRDLLDELIRQQKADEDP